jgi:hypothetical protein
MTGRKPRPECGHPSTEVDVVGTVLADTGRGGLMADVGVRPQEAVPVPRERPRTWWLVALVAAVSVVVWLALRPAPDPLERRTPAGAVEAVQEYADRVLAVVGAGPPTWTSTTPSTCPGDPDAIVGQGVYQLPVAVEGHRDLLQRLREEWRAQGFGIGRDTGPNLVAASSPHNALSITVWSAAPAPSVTLVVRTPCYRKIDAT